MEHYVEIMHKHKILETVVGTAQNINDTKYLSAYAHTLGHLCM